MLHQSFLGKWKLLSSSSSAAKLNLCGKRRRWCLFYFSRNKEGTFYSRNFFSTWLSSAVKLSVEANEFSLIGFELRHRHGNKVYESKIRIGFPGNWGLRVLNRWQGCRKCYWSISCASYKKILNKNAHKSPEWDHLRVLLPPTGVLLNQPRLQSVKPSMSSKINLKK